MLFRSGYNLAADPGNQRCERDKRGRERDMCEKERERQIEIDEFVQFNHFR